MLGVQARLEMHDRLVVRVMYTFLTLETWEIRGLGIATLCAPIAATEDTSDRSSARKRLSSPQISPHTASQPQAQGRRT